VSTPPSSIHDMAAHRAARREWCASMERLLTERGLRYRGSPSRIKRADMCYYDVWLRGDDVPVQVGTPSRGRIPNSQRVTVSFVDGVAYVEVVCARDRLLMDGSLDSWVSPGVVCMCRPCLVGRVLATPI
jgi:hypothetical protein